MEYEEKLKFARKHHLELFDESENACLFELTQKSLRSKINDLTIEIEKLKNRARIEPIKVRYKK